jgi:hypothetical protein
MLPIRVVRLTSSESELVQSRAEQKGGGVQYREPRVIYFLPEPVVVDSTTRLSLVPPCRGGLSCLPIYTVLFKLFNSHSVFRDAHTHGGGHRQVSQGLPKERICAASSV